jgi:hypothetical protein
MCLSLSVLQLALAVEKQSALFQRLALPLTRRCHIPIKNPFVAN